MGGEVMNSHIPSLKEQERIHDLIHRGDRICSQCEEYFRPNTDQDDLCIKCFNGPAPAIHSKNNSKT